MRLDLPVFLCFLLMLLVPCALRGEMVGDVQIDVFDKVPADHLKDSVVILRGSAHKEVKIPHGMAGVLVRGGKAQGLQSGEYFRRGGSVALEGGDFILLLGENKVQSISRHFQNGGIFLYYSPNMTLSFFNEAVPRLQEMNNKMTEKVKRESAESRFSKNLHEQSGSIDENAKALTEINGKLATLKEMMETVLLSFKILITVCVGLVMLVILLVFRIKRLKKTDGSFEITMSKSPHRIPGPLD